MLPKNSAPEASLPVDFPGVDELLEKLQVAKARGEARGQIPDAFAADLVKDLEGADATKIPLLRVAREFLHGKADENQVRAAAAAHFRQAARTQADGNHADANHAREARKRHGAKSRKG